MEQFEKCQTHKITTENTNVKTVIKMEEYGEKMQKTLYNGWSDNCCAYCKLHQCGLTAKQMKGRECLRKQCWHLEKKEDHAYWKQRARTKEKRKNRKEYMAEYIREIYA